MMQSLEKVFLQCHNFVPVSRRRQLEPRYKGD